MSVESTKSGFSENQVVDGFINGGMLEYDAGVIQTLESNEEIIRYGMLAPSSPDAQQLTFIMYKIMKGQDISDDESDFLDSIDSRFIGHSKKSDLTNREILCLFLNQYWDWSMPEWTNIRNVSVSGKGLFKAYSDFLTSNKFNRKTRKMTKEPFLTYLSRYSNIKRSRQNVGGKKIDNYVVTNLPAYKESLTKIPEFDLRNMVK